MPPKRKAPTITITTEKPDSTTDIVKANKKVKKVMIDLDKNGIQNEDDQVSSPPKRSRPARSTKNVVSYDETKNDETKKHTKTKKKPQPKKPSKADKPSSTKQSPQPGPSWRVTPDHLPADEDSKMTPKKKTDKKRKEKTQKLLKEKIEENENSIEQTEKPENIKEKTEKPEKSKAKKEKTVKTKKTKPDENFQNGDGEKKKTNTKKAKSKSAEENLQNDDVVKENGITSEVEEPKIKELQNKTDTEWSILDFSCHKKNEFGVKHNLIISTWNVGGVKSWVKKGCMEYLKHEGPDIFCIQETKCSKVKLPEELTQLKNYHKYWCSSDKEGYAGVGLLSVKEPKSVTYGIDNEDQDVDGRCITAEYDEFILVNVYVPNSGRKLVTMPKRLEWNKAFKEYVKELEKKKPVIICGDMNVSHNAIDLARPQSNTKNAGFTPEEREGMTELLSDGFVDVYRHLYPDQKDVYSFWTYMANCRAKNVGWRLDYFIISKDIMKGVCDLAYRTQVFGSDHCPVTLFINI